MANANEERERSRREEELDEALEDSFPASDPPAQGVTTGTGRPEHDDPEQKSASKDRAGERLDEEKRIAHEAADETRRVDLDRGPRG